MFDGVLYPRDKNGLIFIDLLILKILQNKKGICDLYWGSNFKFNINKNDLINLYNYNNIQFSFDHRNKLERYPDEITLQKVTGAPGWFEII